jgi:hypothetical protein
VPLDKRRERRGISVLSKADEKMTVRIDFVTDLVDAIQIVKDGSELSLQVVALLACA